MIPIKIQGHSQSTEQTKLRNFAFQENITLSVSEVFTSPISKEKDRERYDICTGQCGKNYSPLKVGFTDTDKIFKQ